MHTLPAPRELVLEQLERMLASDTFAGAERSRVLLRFLVEHVVENQSDRLKEYTIGSEALGRGDTFDPRTDPIVRAEASRLRSRIERYYATNGVTDTVLITLPKGSYVPQFQSRAIPEAAPVAGAARSTPGRLQRFIWFVLGGVTVGAAVALFVWVKGREPRPADLGEVESIDIELGAADRSLGSDFGNDVILSQDGTRIVFVARGSDHVLRLMTLRLSQPRTVVGLPDTDGARAPFFSPDGRWVGFWADAQMKRVSVDGGSPVRVTDAIDFGGGSWGEDGYIIATINGALTRVSSTSGEKEVVADLKKERVIPLWPDFLPGGRHVLFTAVGPQGPDRASIEILSLSDGKRTTVVRAGTFGRYLDDGYLVYVNQGTLYAMPIDPQQPAARVTGVPVLKDRVAYSTIFGNAQLAISKKGALIYRRSPAGGNLVVSWLDRGGGIEPLMNKPGSYTFPRLSPDGQRLAINVTDSGVPITEIYDRQRDRTTRLPFAPGSMAPVWHPGGFLVLGSRTGMSWMKADDMSKLETLTPTSNVQIPSSFTADGTRLAYAEPSPSLDLWTVPVSHAAGKLTAGKPEPFLRTPYFESHPSFSPDGQWLAYGSGQYGMWEVYVRRFPPDGSREIKVSERGGRIARWLPNGRELVYRTDDHRLMVVGYQVRNGTFIAGKPKEWTPVRLGDTGVISNFDVHGDRILGLVPAAREEEERIRNQVTVMPRFSDEVRARLSAGGK